MTRHHALLGCVLALPLALLVLATPPGERLVALLAAAPALIGLAVLEPVLRQRVSEGTAFWTILLAVLATGLFPLLAHESDPQRAAAFLLGALGVTMLGREPSAPRVATFGLLAVLGLMLAPLHFRGHGLARALFGSRGGLLYETPLLWGALAGLALLVRREGRAAAPLVAVGLLPFALAPFGSGGFDVALPALLVALAVALEAAAAFVSRRPAVAVAASALVLGVSNLLFMEQYRYTLKRDDTVSFPQVSAGNARLFARGVGSPQAWPANWIWSARHGLPVERWDLLSGQRLDPTLEVTIDVGDLDQDAAFLLAGWSVRHECGQAVCREVEGQAEMILPLDRATTADLHVFVVGTGALGVTVNGERVGTIDVDGERFDRGPFRCDWRRGPNRVVLETLTGTQLVDGVAIRGSAR